MEENNEDDSSSSISSSSDSSDDSEDTSDQETSDKENEDKQKKKASYPHKVKIYAEVMSNDLNTVNIWWFGKHPEAAVEHLEMSHHLRQIILQYSMIQNMTTSHIKKTLNHHWDNYPQYRLPFPKQINNIVANIRRRERLTNDPLLAIKQLAINSPHLIFNYHYEIEDPYSFQVGIHCTYAIQSLLLYGSRNGVGLDSSWRNKNENRAPVTFLITSDFHKRLVPGPVYISADIKTDTLKLFLKTVKKNLENEALALVNDLHKLDSALAPFSSDLIQQAQAVVNQKSWDPLFFMIDKSKAEKNALQQVWSKVSIRLCQFHVIQALLRWEVDNVTDSSKPKLSRIQKFKLCWAFRELQRASDENEWLQMKKVFEARVASISPSQASLIIQYFEVNWFSQYWRGSIFALMSFYY
ncbi:hypothetical protein E1B28_003329 [Marasmius oreades]|uniref:MULE transposase domain-containing protein n=1 Tax=Marasmius oreades TaxID=181124 RepID=A0A9P7UKF4_9AGAR|nr:uncharacterized protein E1B28_003329 [Marasmius oreades]KAG7085788.1 hypothetical protein E1B28_003329 [Marasmius oreades]